MSKQDKKNKPAAETTGQNEKTNINSEYQKGDSGSSLSLNISKIKNEIMDYLRKRGNDVTFVELSKNIPGFNGEYEYWANKEYGKVAIWTDMSDEAVKALLELNREWKIFLCPVSVIRYILEGLGLTLPIATDFLNQAYETPHWSPTVVGVLKGFNVNGL